MCANAPAPEPDPGGQAGRHWLLFRRHLRPGKRALYHCWMARPVPPGTMVRVAERRWTIEERFQTGKALSA